MPAESKTYGYCFHLHFSTDQDRIECGFEAIQVEWPNITYFRLSFPLSREFTAALLIW